MGKKHNTKTNKSAFAKASADKQKSKKVSDKKTWFGANLPTFKSWSVHFDLAQCKHFRITNKLLTALFIIAPIGAIFSLGVWFYHTYYMTPIELLQIVFFNKSPLTGLEVLPGYLEITDLPGILEKRKNTVDIIKEIMEEEKFTMYDLVDLARCESTYNPSAYNRSSGATGLFQYKKMTWGTTPYCGEDIWDVKAQTLATIWMFEHNRFREWECFRAGKLKSSPPFYRDYHGCGKEVE